MLHLSDSVSRIVLRMSRMLATLILLSGCSAGPDRPPNIVFFLVDDLGWKDVGFMGSDYYETPHIDQLASEGMVFTNAYANAPNCAPTRACLMSGQYTPRHGVYTVGNPDRGESKNRRLIPTPNKMTLDTDIVTLAEALSAAGYVSASMGKWHLGTDPAHGPLAQGFDVNIAGHSAGSPRSYFSPYRNPFLPDGPEGEHLTDRLIDEAVAFIEAHREGPFFLYLPFYAVHTPLQAKAELIAKYEQKPGSNGQHHPTYAGMVENTDTGIGRVLETLDRLDLTDETVVIFFSDNGGYGPATSMAPLRGSKGMLYEGGIRVPMIVRWPGRVKPGGQSDTPVIGVDFYPTLLEIAGLPAPADQPLDGLSLLPLLTGDGAMAPREALFWHFPAYLQRYAGIEGPWRTTPAGAVRAGDWKLIEFFEDGRLELYHLAEDIGERRNLAEHMPEKRQELYELMLQWRRELQAPVPTELNPEYDPDA